MKYCPSCGENIQDAPYCPECGAPINHAEEEPSNGTDSNEEGEPVQASQHAQSPDGQLFTRRQLLAGGGVAGGLGLSGLLWELYGRYYTGIDIQKSTVFTDDGIADRVQREELNFRDGGKITVFSNSYVYYVLLDADDKSTIHMANFQSVKGPYGYKTLSSVGVKEHNPIRSSTKVESGTYELFYKGLEFPGHSRNKTIHITKTNLPLLQPSQINGAINRRIMDPNYEAPINTEQLLKVLAPFDRLEVSHLESPIYIHPTTGVPETLRAIDYSQRLFTESGVAWQGFKRDAIGGEHDFVFSPINTIVPIYTRLLDVLSASIGGAVRTRFERIDRLWRQIRIALNVEHQLPDMKDMARSAMDSLDTANQLPDVVSALRSSIKEEMTAGEIVDFIQIVQFPPNISSKTSADARLAVRIQLNTEDYNSVPGIDNEVEYLSPDVHLPVKRVQTLPNKWEFDTTITEISEAFGQALTDQLQE